MGLSSRYAYRTEDREIQNLLEKSLDCYQRTSLFTLSDIEIYLVSQELNKLRKVAQLRICDASARIDTTVPL